MSRDERHLLVIGCAAHDCIEEFVGTDGQLWCEVIGDAMGAGWDLELDQPDLCPDHYGRMARTRP